MLKLRLAQAPTTEQAHALKALLIQNPGKNVVSLNFLSDTGNEESIVIGKFPTSLSIKDAARFGVCLPCNVVAEKPEEHLDFMTEQMALL
jgi:hypothetical protein